MDLKHTDFRIGNYVRHEWHPYPNPMIGRVTGIFFQNASWVVEVRMTEKCDIEKIIPFLIEERILSDMGLKKSQKTDDNRKVWVTDYYMFLNHHYWFSFSKRSGLLKFYIDDIFVKEFQYVHQVQNFYFALTGDELPVNFSL